MAKMGLIHDYDLMANNEASASGNTCAVCDASPVHYQWSDYSGEAMCTRCGCAYQLKWGTEQQVSENAYPYLNLRDDFVPIAREYWEERKTFVHYGTSLSRNDGMPALIEWVHENHPEALSSGESAA